MLLDAIQAHEHLGLNVLEAQGINSTDILDESEGAKYTDDRHLAWLDCEVGSSEGQDRRIVTDNEIVS